MRRTLALVLAVLLLLTPLGVHASELDPSSQDGTEFPAEGGPREDDPQEEGPGEEDLPVESAPETDDPGTDGADTPSEDDTDAETIPPELITDVHVAYIKGSNDRFKPEDAITKAETCSIVYGLLAQLPEQVDDTQFSDVAPTAWYAAFVNALGQMGVVAGPGDGTFQPSKPITRAEFVQLLCGFYRDELADAGLENPFSDVPEDQWYSQAVAFAAQQGWISGYLDGTFCPEKNIKRSEAVVIVNRMLGRRADTASLAAAGQILQFVDVAYGYWAYPDIMEASLVHNHGLDDLGQETWSEVTVPAAQHAPGYHLLDGQLYKIDSTRHFVRDVTDGVLQFGHDGRYTSGDAELDQLLTPVILRYTVEGASRSDNLRSLFEHITKLGNYTYLGRNNHHPEGATGWEIEDAKVMLRTHRGNCFNFAGLFTMMARRLGYQAKGVSGWIVLGEGWDPDDHGWVEIVEDGKTYFCDPEEYAIRYNQKHLHPDWKFLLMLPYRRGAWRFQPEYQYTKFNTIG